MRIRLARERDLEAAAQLWFERMSLLSESDSQLRLAPGAVAAWQSRARQRLDERDCRFYAAEADDALAGFIVVGISDNPAWLLPARLGHVIEMAVDLHRSHRGLSRALLERACDWLRERDIEVLQAPAWSFYPVEEAFWLASGARLRSRTFWLKL